MSITASYQTTLRFRVINRTSNEVLMEPFVDSFPVQPPVYYRDDTPLLEMYLNVQAKIACMVKLRRLAAQKDPQVASLQGHEFTVLADLLEYQLPTA